MSNITIENVGPIKHLAIDMAPGVTVLKGRNGAGKSEAIAAADAAVKRKGRLSVHDDADRGQVDAFGVTLRVRKSTRASGQLEVHSLEGRLDLATLVDPGIIDDEKADLRRVKALASLGGVKLTPADFYDLAANREEFDRIVPDGSVVLDTDPVALAEAIKRRFEKAARDAAALSKSEEAKAAACRSSAEDVDVTGEDREDVLTDVFDDAAATETRLKTERRERLQAAQERAAAVVRLASVERPDLDDFHAALKGAIDRYTEAHEEVARLQRQRADLQAQIQALIQSIDNAAGHAARAKEAETAALEAMGKAETIVESLADLESQAAAEVEPVPTDETIEAATATRTVAREALVQGGLIRKAKQQLDAAREHMDTAHHAGQDAERLRESGRAIDNVLSDAIAGDVLQVRRGRLVCQHTERGEIPYSELSEGERWRIAIDLAIPHVEAGGIILIQQEAWEGLDPTNRRAIHAYAITRGVGILTAQATDGELRVERFKVDA